MTQTKGILIDSAARTVSLVTVGDFRDIQAKIGTRCFSCPATLPNGDTLYVDDEGLLNHPEHFFSTPMYPDALAGNALLLGGDNETGGTVDVKTEVARVAATVTFYTVDEIRAKYGI